MSKKFKKSSGKASPKLTAALNKAVAIAGRVMEVANWVLVVAMIIFAVFGFTGGAFPGSSGEITEELNGLNVYGLEAKLVDGNTVNYGALGWFSVGSALVAAAMAMVFRNICLIAKNSRKKTPFTEDNMRMVKEIGISFIAASLIGAIFSIIIELGTGAEVFADVNTFLPGIIMLYLTQIFARGVELEDDVKDLA